MATSDFSASLACSPHIQALAGLMADRDLDMSFAGGHAKCGTKFVIVVCQGDFAEPFADAIERIAAEIVRLRAKAISDASHN